MNCTQFDVKALLLGELSGPEKAEVEKHIDVCAVCREEFERLEATRAALLSVRDEEVPRRIAFVSDGVFEPRWWQRLWRSGPALGFASAAMLSAAILVHAFARPAQVSAPQAPAMSAAAVEVRIEREVEKRLQPAVLRAVAEAGERNASQVQQAIALVRHDFESQRNADRAAVDEAFVTLQKKLNQRYMMASADMGGRP